jgi:hypothetical protein
LLYKQHVFSAKDNNNLPLSGGHLYLYKSGTEIPVTMYMSLGSSIVPSPQPYVLNEMGVADNLFLPIDAVGPFRLNITDKNGAQMPDFPVDGLSKIIDAQFNHMSATTIPTVSFTPTHPTLKVGKPYNMTVQTTGDNLRFQWFKNGQRLIGEDKPDIHWEATSLSNAGTYYVQVWNNLGTVISQANMIAVIQ